MLSSASVSFSDYFLFQFTCVYSVTPVCIQCYTCVYTVLHLCVYSVTPVCIQCYTCVYTMLHLCVYNVTPVYIQCYTCVYTMLHLCVYNVTPVCIQSYTCVYTMLHLCVYNVTGMQNLGVRTAESYDERGASRFHCFNPGTHIHGGYPNWYLIYDSHGARHVSRYPRATQSSPVTK